jgi:hypothetical protein
VDAWFAIKRILNELSFKRRMSFFCAILAAGIRHRSVSNNSQRGPERVPLFIVVAMSLVIQREFDEGKDGRRRGRGGDARQVLETSHTTIIGVRLMRCVL